MAVVDDVAQLIHRRLDELSEERERLKRALSQLDSKESVPSRPRRKRASSGKAAAKANASKGSGGRVSKAERESALLAYIKSHPRAGAKEIAGAIGTTDTNVYNLLAGLRRDGRLTRQGDRKLVEVKATSRSPKAKSSSRSKAPAKARSAKSRREGETNAAASGRGAKNKAGK